MKITLTRCVECASNRIQSTDCMRIDIAITEHSVPGMLWQYNTVESRLKRVTFRDTFFRAFVPTTVYKARCKSAADIM